MKKNLKKKILFVATQFPPNDSIGTQRIVKFIKYLELKGWDIHVLTLEEKYYRNSSNSYQFYLPNDIHIYRRRKIDIFGLWDAFKRIFHINVQQQTKTSDDININKKMINEDSKNLSILYELKELISNLLQYPDQDNGFCFSIFFSTLRLISKHKIPYLFISSPPHSPVIPVTLLKKFKNIFYIIDFRDPWSRSQWQQKPKHLYQKIERRLDLFFEMAALKAADVAIFNTEQLKREFSAYYENTPIPQKFYFISNGFDPELRVRFSDGRPKHERSNDKITILHTGTLYKKRNPEVIFDGLLKFREINPEKAKAIEIRFVGSLSGNLNYLEQFIKAECLSDQITFQPRLSYDNILEEMKEADWLLLLQPGTTFQIPAKFYDYLLVEKPIWGVLEENSVGEVAIKKLNVGYVSFCHSVNSIVEFFKLVTSGKMVDFLPDESELQKYSIPYLVEQFEQIILDH